MSGKFVFLLALLVSIAAIASGASGPASHHLIVGSRTPYDKLVNKQSVVKSSSILQIVKVQQTFYTLSERSRITEVRALDQKTNGNGAYASLIGGGPGANNVTLLFKSQRGHGINFIVEVYAE